jgi:hypothetical protein
MINTSPEIGEIAGALALAQAEMQNVGKDGRNPHFRSTYATLGAVLDEVRPALAKQGIAIVQMAINGEGTAVGVMTRFVHKSGQWIESALYVTPSKFDAQGAGSVISYLRRYALMSMAGVWQEDDDGEASVGRPTAALAGKGADATSTADSRTRSHTGDHPRKADAEDAYKRIRTAINAAIRPDMIDELVKANSDSFLPLIKEVSEQHYDLLMTLANARKQELYASA